jgi:hypothetical protein
MISVNWMRSENLQPGAKTRGVFGRFVWRPSRILRSLAEFRPEEQPPGAVLVDVKPRIHEDADDRHPLLVAEIPGGKVIGDALLAVTADDAVIGGLQGLAGCANPEDHWLVRRRRFRIPRRIAGTALLLGANSGNYFHWCFESLPRWRLLEEAGWDATRANWVLLSKSCLPFQQQTLDALGVPAGKVLHCSKSDVLQFDRLVVPSMPLAGTGLTTAWTREFVRRTFLPANVPAPAERIYVSRRGIRRRRLVNEAELESGLSKRGFTICAPEKMAVREQAALFARSCWVVAPHGAGLANVVFTSPGGQLIELFHPAHPNACYEELARACGWSYLAILGQSTSTRPSEDDRTAEFEVNIPDVLAALPSGAAEPPAIRD